MIVASICLGAVNFVRPWWTTARATVRLGIDAAALVISLFLLRTGSYADVSGAGLSTTKAAEATHAMNLGLQIAFAVMAGHSPSESSLTCAASSANHRNN